MRALVTGADGFVGRWLVRHLREAGDEVFEAGGEAATIRSTSVRHVDVTVESEVDSVLEWAAPDAVYHLAAVAFGPDASRSVEHAVRVTVNGTGVLLGCAQRLALPPVVLVPSSSEVYGVPRGLPIDEDHPAFPTSPYGATKLAQEAVGLAFQRAGSMPVILPRSFNHIGPGQREEFVVPSLAMQLARLSRASTAQPLVVGNLDAQRDFTDVRDVVRAYRMLVVKRHAGIPVNVASGRAISIRQVLADLQTVAGLQVEITVDPERLRPTDAPRIVGSSSRLREAIGWEPRVPWMQTLSDVWHDALERTGTLA